MPTATKSACLQKTSSRLSNLLQTITRSSAALEQFCTGNPDAERRFGALRIGVEGAKLVVADLLAQVATFSGLPTPALAQPVAHPATAQAAPAATPDEAPAPSAAESPAGFIVEDSDSPEELILIIDDEQTIVTNVTDMLTSAGYRVIGCTSPFDAIEAYKHGKDAIALVILDYTLPIMNGQDVFDEILAINPSAAVMLSSGFAEQEDVNAMLARGLSGFLPKPYTQERLLAQVRSTIALTRGGNGAAATTPAAAAAIPA